MDADALLTVLVALAAGLGVALTAAIALLVSRRPARTVPASDGVPVLEPVGDPQPYVVLDIQSVFNLYAQMPGASILLRRSWRRSRSGRFDLGVNPVNVGAESGTDSQLDVEHRPVEHAARAASIVEKFLQDGGRITTIDLGAASDDGPLSAVLKDLRDGADRIGLKVPQAVEDGLRDAWRQQNRSLTDSRWDAGGAYVRMRADFEYGPGAAEGSVELRTAVEDDSGTVRILVRCRAGDVQQLFPSGSGRVKATCLGLRRWDAATRQLELDPLFVYRY